MGGTGALGDDDELADRVSIPSPSKCLEDPITDVADVGASSFHEISPIRQEDKGAEGEGGSNDEATTETPLLGKRERTSDISATEAHKKARLETALDPTDLQAGSTPISDPEDATPPYGDKVDYGSTPSPPKEKDTEASLGKSVIVPLDSGAGSSQSKIPIMAESFLTDRIVDIMKTFDRHQSKSAQEEVLRYCRCLSAFGMDTSELESRIKSIFDHAEAIEELASSPECVPIAQLMKANEDLASSRQKLASHMATRDALLQANESVSSRLQQTQEKISHLKSIEAELSLQLEGVKDSLKKLQSTQEELQQDVASAEKKQAAATEAYTDTKESTGFRDLIELFEERRQMFKI